MTRKDDPPAPRRGQSQSGHLSDGDRELWRHVARSVTPVAKTKARLLDSAAVEAMEQALRSEAAQPAPSGSKSASNKPKRHAPGHGRSETATQHGRIGHGPPSQQQSSDLAGLRRVARELHGIDRNELRRIRAGRMSIDARLDLHGLRQHEAHGELRHFLFRSHAKGARWVIVITGKGSRQRRTEGVEVGSWTRAAGEESANGVLREKVPQWLHDRDLRAIVVGFTTAGPRHGGEGALYVRLRSRTLR